VCEFHMGVGRPLTVVLMRPYVCSTAAVFCVRGLAAQHFIIYIIDGRK
jgi:hypothetical protein